MLGFLSRFVDSNDRELHRIEPLVARINELEPEMQARSDEELRAFVDEIRDEIREAGQPEEPSDDELNNPERNVVEKSPKSASSASTPISRTRWTASCRRSTRLPARRCSGR